MTSGSGLGDALMILGVLIFSVVVHENAHGWVALFLGDQTAKRLGRLTLNPIKHLDPVGSVILPAIMALTTGSAFGWAKPVPVNPGNLRGRDRAGFAIVAAAGPASNFVIAFVAAIVLKAMGLPGGVGWRVVEAFLIVNLALAAFNLLPIPPLDGSRLIRLFLSPRGLQRLDRFEPYGFVVLLLLFTLLPGPFGRIVAIVQRALVRLLPL